LIRAANPAPTIKPNAKTTAAMTIRSGHHVAGSPRAGRGGGKIGHASIRWLLFHMAKAIRHFSEASFNGAPRLLIKLGLVSGTDWQPRQQARCIAGKFAIIDGQHHTTSTEFSGLKSVA
jgi:hypothetical protein